MPHTRRVLLAAAGASPWVAAAASRGGVYSRLGVKPIINGMGTVTVVGGSLMPPEVVRAMDEAARSFVYLPDLQKRAGARIAQLLNVPAAMVTAGAASAITVATAACMTRGDARRLRQLPDPSGMPHEVIQQRSHRSGYEHQITLCGARIVTVETARELENSISDRTAMLFFLNKAEPEGRIKREEFIAIGKKRGIPTFNDAAADVPPKENLGLYVKQGFDLVAFSGGKGLLGPQCSGLLLGRADLIEAGLPAISPAGGIGRGMKVGKEEIAGLVAAVERYLRTDHDAEFRLLDSRVTAMREMLAAAPGVKTGRVVPEIANHVPHLVVEWDPSGGLPTTDQAVEKLRAGDPPIWVLPQGRGRLMVSVWMMRGREHLIVARRLREVLAAS